MQTNQPGSLKDRFENYGSAPSDGLWNAIETSLGGEKKKRRGFFWWWFSGIAAGLLVIFGFYQLGYQHGKSDEDNKQTNQNVQHEETIVATDLDQQDSVVTLDQITNSPSELTQNTTEKDYHELRGDDKPENKVTVQYHKKNSDSVNTGFANNISLNPEQTKEEETKFSMIRLRGEVICPVPNQLKFPHLENPIIDVNREDGKTGSWEFGISGEYLATASHSADMMLQPSSLTFDSGANTTLINGTESLSTPAIESNNTIYRPFDFSLNVARKFNQRISLNSGIVFHRLIEKNRYYSGDISLAHLKFTTLGIPLSIEFDYVSSKRFELSIGAGVMNEFPLLVTTRTSYYSTALAQGKSTQVSSGYFGAALLNLKFDYKFSDSMRLGLAPSMRYYFVQRLNSPHPVLERKFWLGMQAGITFCL
ncbi:MAG: hypothetical protein IPM74_13310 [Crocinitomicaceae bacterium]|nr:hypothetical protein [Crocinitomicaceae bacterium]MBK8926851.1 hypothetical protein [Crocinitomicaceae bacterium]